MTEILSKYNQNYSVLNYIFNFNKFEKFWTVFLHPFLAQNNWLCLEMSYFRLKALLLQTLLAAEVWLVLMDLCLYSAMHIHEFNELYLVLFSFLWSILS